MAPSSNPARSNPADRGGVPLHYSADVLEAMVGLARSGAPHNPHFDRALQVIRDKRTANARWIMDRSTNGKMLVDVEVAGAPSEWLTHRALFVLQQFGVDDG